VIKLCAKSLKGLCLARWLVRSVNGWLEGETCIVHDATMRLVHCPSRAVRRVVVAHDRIGRARRCYAWYDRRAIVQVLVVSAVPSSQSLVLTNSVSIPRVTLVAVTLSALGSCKVCDSDAGSIILGGPKVLEYTTNFVMG
jgi:hypothetical protein